MRQTGQGTTFPLLHAPFKNPAGEVALELHRQSDGRRFHRVERDGVELIHSHAVLARPRNGFPLVVRSNQYLPARRDAAATLVSVIKPVNFNTADFSRLIKPI